MNNFVSTNVELVEIKNQQAVTDSRKVAEVFDKDHKHVLDSIRQILAAENSAAKFFYETTYENRGKQYPIYYLNRDGLNLLAMGFTGAKAMKWKIKYIEAFNAMEEKLKAMEKPMTTADMFLQNAMLMKEHETKLAKLTEENIQLKKETESIKTIQKKQQSTLDTLNGVCTNGTKRQKLNNLVRNYANKNGVQYASAWEIFKEMFNNAYHTNLNLRITHYTKSNFLKKRPSAPQYFELTNQLDDALRVAEKM